MIQKVLAWCRARAGYDGPNLDRTVRELEGKTAIHPDWVKKIFELGYRRGYADCAEYIEEWIEDEEG